MKELKCPQCGNVFSVDEADYAFILNQVKTHEFEAELKARLSEIQQQSKAQQETETLKITQSYQGKLNEKEVELSKKESTIAQLQAQINSFNQAKTLELEAERLKQQQEIARLKALIDQNNTKIQVAILEEQNKAKDNSTLANNCYSN